METSSKDKGVSFRPKTGIRKRLEDLSAATERPKTFFLDKSIEAHLPELERRYAGELRALHRKRAQYPEHISPESVSLNESPLPPATSHSPTVNSSPASEDVDKTDKFLQGLSDETPALDAPKPPAKPATKHPGNLGVVPPKEKGKKQRSAAHAGGKHPSTT